MNIKISKRAITEINTDKYAYLLEDGTVVENPEVGKEYIVLPRISGGSTILIGASGACEEHLREPCYLVEFCSGHKQIRYTYPAEFCELCEGVYSSLILCRASLQRADLEGADLRRANLQRADLEGADLRGANLCGANLRGANLCGANLRGANLRGANLWEADLRGANLWEADLCGANLCGANLREANLEGANLEGALGVV